jgi:hypothetical protein
VRAALIVEVAPSQPRAAPPGPLADDLATWLAAHPGPQRQLLTDLRATWTERLTGAEDPALIRTLTKGVSSPKLAAERDAWIATLGITRGAAPQARAEPTVVVRPPKPRKDPGAWLDRFATSATDIDMASERVSELPARIERYTQLTSLQLAYNKIARLPPELCRLPRLAELDVRGNELQAVPDELGQLMSLTRLNIEENEIALLPDSLCALENLAALSIGRTQITALPAQIGRLRKLSYVSLENCVRLKQLPESFFELPALAHLSLHGTRLPGAQLARLRTTFPACDFYSFFR